VPDRGPSRTLDLLRRYRNGLYRHLSPLWQLEGPRSLERFLDSRQRTKTPAPEVLLTPNTPAHAFPGALSRSSLPATVPLPDNLSPWPELPQTVPSSLLLYGPNFKGAPQMSAAAAALGR
jgi:hypothetical protein